MKDWDLLLPHVMQVMRSTPHKITGESANFLMLGREIRLPSLITHEVTNDEPNFTSTYAQELTYRLKKAHELLRSQQGQARLQDSKEPGLFKNGDYVWLRSYQNLRAKAKKLNQKFVGPYLVVEALPYHTYRLSRNGKETIHHEGRIKLHVSADKATSEVLPREGPRAIQTPRARPKNKENENDSTQITTEKETEYNPPVPRPVVPRTSQEERPLNRAEKYDIFLTELKRRVQEEGLVIPPGVDYSQVFHDRLDELEGIKEPSQLDREPAVEIIPPRLPPGYTSTPKSVAKKDSQIKGKRILPTIEEETMADNPLIPYEVANGSRPLTRTEKGTIFLTELVRQSEEEGLVLDGDIDYLEDYYDKLDEIEGIKNHPERLYLPNYQ